MNNGLSANTALSHYRIVSKIGAGGMGEVYLAQDTKLDRKVAIKFLNEEFSKDADKLGRFIQEAKAASALNHPNILTVYEIGEVDGKNYIATELIDGQTLREHLAHKESLQLNAILKIGVQVSEALSAAHQAGIIHRDIKPENIMLRKDGYAKVLDFGLAKLSEPRPVGVEAVNKLLNALIDAQGQPVAAADGRTSMARKKVGFEVTEAPQPFLFAGLLLADMTAPEGQAYLLFNPAMGMETAITPVGRGRSRTHVAYQDGAEFRLQGNENISRFIEEAKRAESVAAYYEGARAIGPLASFRCGDFWADHPYKDGIALIGDAAATSDPAFGQGLSQTVRDVRVLRDHLLATDDWDAAGHAYAAEHDGYYATMRKVEDWFRSLFLEQGPDADSRRARALPLIAEDQTRVPDHFFSGPDLPADETVRRSFFGED
jgi:tRNA A-37 threonylcarbamoyl transferase component Bud32